MFNYRIILVVTKNQKPKEYTMSKELDKRINEAKNVKEVTRWESMDGLSHYSVDSAVMANKKIIRMRYANELLELGKSIGEIYDELSITVVDPVLYDVNKDSQLVISHYQCRDTPGYKPCGFNENMNIKCFGNAGSWSGAYGNWENSESVARYAKDRNSILKPKE